MNAVFGGQFSSRLNLNLREKKGYTYGARSMFEWRVHAARAVCRHRQRADAGDRRRRWPSSSRSSTAWSGGRPITAAEVEFCRKFITPRLPGTVRDAQRSWPRNWKRSSSIACRTITSIPWSPGSTRSPADDVLAMAKKYLKVGELTIVVVGDRAKIEAGLRELPSARTCRSIGSTTTSGSCRRSEPRRSAASRGNDAGGTHRVGGPHD